MRILYLDIDCLRPDHLGCYGYHRATSPTIDGLAARGVRMDQVYVSDAPCLPSRTALFTGRFGIHTGVTNHGGTASEPFHDGPSRGFGNLIGRTSWMRALRDAGLYTATISPFGERHAAWHFYAGFREAINPGKRGLERADEIAPLAEDWLERNGARDGWFLHVNLWDPHTPYRTPVEQGEPFAHAPLPAWYGEAIRQEHWSRPGPHSAREAMGFDDDPGEYGPKYPRQPFAIDSLDAARRMFDGYDTGIWYADLFVARILTALERAGVADDTAVILSGDHGEQLGELNVYGDHQLADEHTCHVPMIIAWPGVTDSLRGRVLRSLHYQVDVAATVIDLVDGTVPAIWDGRSFAAQLRAGEDAGRDHLVLSQGAWTCQRAVRFQHEGKAWLYIRTYHDGYHGYPERMLFDLSDDPHEQHDLAAAPAHADLVTQAENRLAHWHAEMMHGSARGIDPFDVTLAEGGPKHVRGELPRYLERLRATGRGDWADRLAGRSGSG